MDNELENRLHNAEKTADTNVNKNTNKIFKKMLYIKNYFNKRFLRKPILLQKHHSFNINNINHRIILQILLMTFLVFMLKITTINCLPVTSKPIENTPEHLAWEAWIMLPPPANSERHRKIMPKSIFVLPTNINHKDNSHNLPVPQPQIQCPPGYRVDNSKCIPTISINRDQLLIDQLTNLLPVSMKPDDNNYDDYDYDYTNGDTINYDLDMLQSYNKQQSSPLINNNNPNTFRDSERDSEPLKINFSLDKFSVAKDDNQNNNKNLSILDIKNDSNEFIMDINNDSSNLGFKLRPFRDQETSSSIIDVSTATIDTKKETELDSTSIEIDSSETESETKDEIDPETILQKQYSTIFGRKESTTSSTTSIGTSETISESGDSNTNSNTTEFNEKYQTETKRESTTTSPTTKSTEEKQHIAGFDYKPNLINNKNNNGTKLPSNSSELSHSYQDANLFITTDLPNDSLTVVSLLSSEENEMSSIIENDSDLNSTTTSDYEYDQMTAINKKSDDKNRNENIEVITEHIEKEQNLEGKLSEESLVLDKSIDENSTEFNSEISLPDEMTTNSPMYDDILSEFVDESSSFSTIENKIPKTSTESTVFIIASTETTKQYNRTTEENINTEKLEHKIFHVNRHKDNHRDRHRDQYHGIPQSTVSISASQPIEWHEDREPLMESIESNNRFVYHHLGSSSIPQINTDISTSHSISSTENKNLNNDISISSSSSPKPTVQPKRDTQADINEQLRIINMIVEENKRRAQAAKIRFPEEGITSTSNPLRSHSLVRFPTESHHESTPYHIATSYYQTQNGGRFDPDKLIFHRRFFQNQQQHATTQTPSNITTAIPDTTKPFWWLPSGWEIDQSGDRPMLIRFWSRSPSRNSEQFSSNTEPYTDQFRTASSNTHHIVTDNLHKSNQHNINFNTNTSDGLYTRQQPTSSLSSSSSSSTTTTTSRYRANSRSPTDNLYQEVPSSQNVYKVLNAARQWKHSKR